MRWCHRLESQWLGEKTPLQCVCGFCLLSRCQETKSLDDSESFSLVDGQFIHVDIDLVNAITYTRTIDNVVHLLIPAQSWDAIYWTSVTCPNNSIRISRPIYQMHSSQSHISNTPVTSYHQDSYHQGGDTKNTDTSQDLLMPSQLQLVSSTGVSPSHLGK